MYTKRGDNFVYIFVYSDRPNDEDVLDIRRLMSEALKFMLNHQNINMNYAIEFVEDSGVPGDAKTAFDEGVFLEIANEVAPWRLAAGR